MIVSTYHRLICDYDYFRMFEFSSSFNRKHIRNNLLRSRRLRYDSGNNYTTFDKSFPYLFTDSWSQETYSYGQFVCSNYYTFSIKNCNYRVKVEWPQYLNNQVPTRQLIGSYKVSGRQVITSTVPSYRVGKCSIISLIKPDVSSNLKTKKCARALIKVVIKGSSLRKCAEIQLNSFYSVLTVTEGY